MNNKQKKNKRAAGLIAVVLCVALVLVGTFAWQSISQKALNENVIELNAGGRVHDDWNGTNKDVYAENFTDETDGQDIFVRIRLKEYMETGENAGDFTKTDGTNYDHPVDTTTRVPLVAGTSFDNTSNWTIRKPGDTTATNPFLEKWTLIKGNEKGTGKTVYMPTFNKNKDSLKVDVRGTYEGTTYITGTVSGTADPYADYYDPYNQSTKLNGDGTYHVGDSSKTLNGGTDLKAYYDADSNADDEDKTKPGNGGVLGTNYTEESEEHIAKETLATEKIYTMDKWKRANYPIGNFWVWDEDGWFYWAAPLEPQTSTGLLLDEVQQKVYMTGKNFYQLEVEGEFASAGDWGEEAANSPTNADTGFEVNGITDDAKDLLNRAASVVKGADGKYYTSYGYNVYKMNDPQGSDPTGFICAGEDIKIGTSKDNTTDVLALTSDLTIAGTNYGKYLLAPAAGQKTAGMYLAAGPDQLLGTSDDIKLWYTGTDITGSVTDSDFSLKGADKVAVTPTTASKTTVQAGESAEFNSSVTLGGSAISNQDVTWTVVPKSGHISSNTTITVNGSDPKKADLKVGNDESANNVLIVTATSKEDDSVVGTYEVTVEGPKKVVIKESGSEVTAQLTASAGDSKTFTAELLDASGNAYATNDVTWTISSSAGTTSSTVTAGALSIDSGEAAGTILSIKATAKSNKKISKTISVKIQ